MNTFTYINYKFKLNKFNIENISINNFFEGYFKKYLRNVAKITYYSTDTNHR